VVQGSAYWQCGGNYCVTFKRMVGSSQFSARSGLREFTNRSDVVCYPMSVATILWIRKSSLRSSSRSLARSGDVQGSLLPSCRCRTVCFLRWEDVVRGRSRDMTERGFVLWPRQPAAPANSPGTAGLDHSTCSRWIAFGTVDVLT